MNKIDKGLSQRLKRQNENDIDWLDEADEKKSNCGDY